MESQTSQVTILTWNDFEEGFQFETDELALWNSIFKFEEAQTPAREFEELLNGLRGSIVSHFAGRFVSIRSGKLARRPSFKVFFEGVGNNPKTFEDIYTLNQFLYKAVSQAFKKEIHLNLLKEALGQETLVQLKRELSQTGALEGENSEGVKDNVRVNSKETHQLLALGNRFN